MPERAPGGRRTQPARMDTPAPAVDRGRLGPAVGVFAYLRVGEIAAAYLILVAANALDPAVAHFGPWLSAYGILLWEYAFWQYGLVSVLAWAGYFAVTRMRVRALPVAVFNALLHPAFVAAWQLQYHGFGRGFGGTLWYSALALAVFDFLFACLSLRFRARRRKRAAPA